MSISKTGIREKRLRELKETRIDKNTAYIEYIAMMSDVALPEESEENTNEMGGENPEIL